MKHPIIKNLTIVFGLLLLSSSNNPVKDLDDNSTLLLELQRELNYFNQIPPNNAPKVFAPNLISLPDRWEGNAHFSADGKEFYFNVFKDSTKSIYRSRLIGGEWETPSPFEAIGQANNWEPFITLDGKEFYFVSSRPPGTPEWNGRIWKSERLANQGWSKPELVNLGYETENGYWFPNTSLKGNLYFGGNFPEAGHKGKGDLYYWDKKNQKVHNLTSLNTDSEEWDPFISPDESLVLWASDKEGGYGGTDLYVSFWSAAERNWGEAINLGDKINTESYEVAPRISPDGKYLFFDRPIKGTQDIYWVSMDVVYSLKPKVPAISAIQQAVEDYYYGYIERDIHRLNRAFDTENGTMKLPYPTETGKAGYKNGLFKEIIPKWASKNKLLEDIKKQCTLEILNIDVVNDKMGVAKIKMKIGPQTYLDVLSLQKFNNEWKITNKMFIEL